MKVRGGRALYLCFVYMPTEGSAAAVIEDSYEDVQRVVQGDFNARVGRSYRDFWRGHMKLVICNSRRCVSEPEWTRVRPSLDQKYNGCPVIEGVW